MAIWRRRGRHVEGGQPHPAEAEPHAVDDQRRHQPEQDRGRAGAEQHRDRRRQPSVRQGHEPSRPGPLLPPDPAQPVGRLVEVDAAGGQVLDETGGPSTSRAKSRLELRTTRSTVIRVPAGVRHCTSSDWLVMSTSRLSSPQAAATAMTHDSTSRAPAPQRSISSPTRTARSMAVPASASAAGSAPAGWARGTACAATSPPVASAQWPFRAPHHRPRAGRRCAAQHRRAARRSRGRHQADRRWSSSSSPPGPGVSMAAHRDAWVGARNVAPEVSGCPARRTAAAPASTATSRACRPAATPRRPSPAPARSSAVTTISLADLPAHAPRTRLRAPRRREAPPGPHQAVRMPSSAPAASGRRRVGVRGAAGERRPTPSAARERRGDRDDGGQQQRDDRAEGCADQVPRARGHRHGHVAAPAAAGVAPDDQRGHRAVGEPGHPAQQHEHRRRRRPARRRPAPPARP